VQWIERALAPLRPQLDAAKYERLVSALAMVIGWEALIVQRDVRALSVREAEDLSAWAARALVRATIDEVQHAKRTRATTKRARSNTTTKRPDDTARHSPRKRR
jgi:hypothetical protein